MGSTVPRRCVLVCLLDLPGVPYQAWPRRGPRAVAGVSCPRVARGGTVGRSACGARPTAPSRAFWAPPRPLQACRVAARPAVAHVRAALQVPGKEGDGNAARRNRKWIRKWDRKWIRRRSLTCP